MASHLDSETSTIEAREDGTAAASVSEKHDHANHKDERGHGPGHVGFSPNPDSRTHDHIPAAHDPARPDLSFPFATTDTELGGFTDEYRTTSKTGYITADLALRPVPSHIHRLPAVLADPEKALRLKQVKLVTWLENDPEDPRNWSNAYKWCTYLALFVCLVLVLTATLLQTSRSSARCRSCRLPSRQLS